MALTVAYHAHVPFFWWIFAGLTRRLARRRLRHTAETIAATAMGAEPPPGLSRPWWAPPAAMTEHQVAVIATLGFLLGVTSYGQSLFTQTIDFTAKTFGASDAQLGVITALTRVGTLVALVGGTLSDRVGRRRVLLWSLALVSTTTLLSAAAPNLTSFAVLQVFVRGGANLAFTVAFIAATEEAPEGARAYSLALVGIASGIGFAIGAVLLPIADQGSQTWRILYALGAFGLLTLPSIASRLTETKRFEALVARDAPRGRLSEIIDRRYGRRFVLMAAVGFLLSLFFAPTSQFHNRYLSDERGFSGSGILVLRAVTQAIPSLVPYYIGGRIAESSGRRPVARRGLAVAALATVVFFTFGGPVLWVASAVVSVAGALAGPSLSAFNTELFPTEVRGTAGAALTLTSVVGSAVGLVVSGYLAGPLGSIGRAVAFTSVAPIIVAIFLIPMLPEARGMFLDDVSPSEV